MLPKAMVPTEFGMVFNIVSGCSGCARKVGAVLIWRDAVIDWTVENGNTVRVPLCKTRSAGAGILALIWLRIFSSSAGALSVVKMLAATMRDESTPELAMAFNNSVRYAAVLASANR